jgi:hypothetical protein
VRRGEFDGVRPGGEKQGLDYGRGVRGSGELHGSGDDELRRRTAHFGELHEFRRRAANSGDERRARECEEWERARVGRMGERLCCLL